MGGEEGRWGGVVWGEVEGEARCDRQHRLTCSIHSNTKKVLQVRSHIGKIGGPELVKWYFSMGYEILR